MMKGPHTSAMAIRKQDGSITVETWATGGGKWYSKVPVVRGVVNFISMLFQGYKCLMRSAELSGFAEDEEPSKFDKWMDAHLGKGAVWIFNILVTVFAVLIAVGLFMLLPSAIVKYAGTLTSAPAAVLTLIEGCLLYTSMVWGGYESNFKAFSATSPPICAVV